LIDWKLPVAGWRLHGGGIMTTYREAFDVLRDAINNPDDPKKLREAKNHPKLKKTLAGFTKNDLEVLNKVSKAAPGKKFKCDDD
jgi:hypothetical protein